MADTPTVTTPQVGVVVPLEQQQKADAQNVLAEENARLKEEKAQLELRFKEGTKKLDELHSTIVSPEYLAFITAKQKGAQQQNANQPQPLTADDLNNMDNAELVRHIGKMVESVVKGTVQPVAAKTEQLDAHAQVRAAADRFSDFWDYQDAMVAIAERNPQLDPQSVYLMAKGLEAASGKSYRNPKPQPQPDREEPREEVSERRGSRPTSSELSTGPSGTLGGNRERQPATYSDAAGAAYDKIFGRGN